jgi:hypothetical protein
MLRSVAVKRDGEVWLNRSQSAEFVQTAGTSHQMAGARLDLVSPDSRSRF